MDNNDIKKENMNEFYSFDDQIGAADSTDKVFNEPQKQETYMVGGNPFDALDKVFCRSSSEPENAGQDAAPDYYNPPVEFFEEFSSGEEYVKTKEEEKSSSSEESSEKKPLALKYRIRRYTALALLLGLVLLILFKALYPSIKLMFRGETINLGPLPTDELDILHVPVHYDYSAPVPACTAVSDSFFSDALLIGDSRVQSIDLYEAGYMGTLLFGNYISVDDALNYECNTNSGKSISLSVALSSGSYKKIYLSFGLNELGWSYSDYFEECYEDLLLSIKALQPEASVYLVGIIPVSSDQSNSSDYLNNTKIQSYNQIIMNLAKKNRVYYLDCAADMADEQGCIHSEFSDDGVYLNIEGSGAWVRFFYTHTVDTDYYCD